MDRNTVIGFVLIGILLVLMFYFNSKSNQARQEEINKEQRRKDSIANANRPKVDPAVARLDSLKQDSILKAQKQLPSTFQTVASTEKFDTVETRLVKIIFSNKGGYPQTVELKKFKKWDGKPLLLQTGSFNKLAYQVNLGNGQALSTSDIYFSVDKKMNADSSQSITYSVKDTTGKPVISNEYLFKNDDYMIDLNINFANAGVQLTNGGTSLLWQSQILQTEKHITYQRQQSHVSYLKNGKYDFDMMGSGGDEKWDADKKLSWIALNPQFFVSTLGSKNKFDGAEMKWAAPDDSLGIMANVTTNARMTIPPGSNTIALQLYYGPNDYDILDKYNNDMHQIVTYGSGLFSFVKYINRHFLLPIWDFLRKYVSSYGIVILLLTLIIRLITSPILYKSYLSGAKTKALKPEVDKLKEKYKDDRQTFSMEQMKLYRSAGVNVLGGCLPALLQIPIFMSLYYFFQANINLRGESFLWAKDLAAYDSIADLSFSIPLYGDHVSLFTLTAVATSLLISLYSMSNMQDQSNPVMKYMPYIFPVILLGVFNRLPAALTWYYTVSNTITLILQYVIQNYIIDHDKILAQIEEKRKQPAKQSKLQERLAAIQESNKKIQELKNKTNKR